MFAIELSTSSDCAREIRGTASIARAVIGRPARSSTSSGFSPGLRMPTSVAPARRPSSCSVDGALTPNTMSAAERVTDRRAGLDVRLVGKARRRTRTRIHHHVVAETQQLRDRRRSGRHPRLTRKRLP